MQVLEKPYHRVGEPVKRRQKSPSERILETLIKDGPLSENQLIERFPAYGYAIPRLMVIEVCAGHVTMEGDVYQITERGLQLVKYGFGKKFFKLSKNR